MLNTKSLLLMVCGFSALLSLECFAQTKSYELKEKIVYSKVKDRELLLDAYLPKSDGPHAAVLVVHGGAWSQGNRWQLRGYAMPLAEQGVACFLIDYRLAPKHKFPAQIDDCRAAVAFIRKNAKKYGVDPNRLGAIGYSAGGHLVSLLGTTGEAPSDANDQVDTRLQAVVAGGAPTDFRALPNRGKFLSYWLDGDLDSAADNFKAASSAAFVDAKDSPMFFFNGTKDELVAVEWSKSCFDALKTAGVQTEMHLIDGAGHMRAAMDPVALSKAREFLLRELKVKVDKKEEIEAPASEDQKDKAGS